MADVTPTTPNQSGPAPMPAEGFGSLAWFKEQIQAAEDKTARYKPLWQKNVASQVNKPLSLIPQKDTVIVPKDHSNVETKKANIFFQNPDITLVPKWGHEAQADAVQAFSALINEYLGEDGVDAETMADEVLSDVICPSGIGFSVLGMEIVQDGMKQVQTGMQPDPNGQPGSVLGLSAPQIPMYESVPNIISQKYFWERVSPLYGLVPERFTGRNFDKSPWLGYKFEMDKARAQATLGVTEEDLKGAGGEPERLNEDEKPKGRDQDVVYGYVISYKASLYRQDVKNPDEIWRLVFLQGMETPIKNDRPYQKYAQDGTTLIGLKGHFVHVYTPRYVSDSAYPPSDVSMTRHQVDELSKGRSQMIQQRDRSKPMRQVNINLVDPEQVEKLKNGETQEIILSTTSEPIVQQIAQATFPRENFEFNQIINRDISEVLGMPDFNRGQQSDTRRTATELSLQSQGSDSRFEKERKSFLKWYLRGATKLGGLIQMFEDTRTQVQIIGQDNQQKMVAWDLTALPMKFVCTAKLDTMVRTDSAAEFKKDLDTYQMTANDPHVNRVELLKSMLRKRGYDAAKIVNPQPPPPAAPKPSFSISIKGDDLNPAAPQFPIIQQLLGESGTPIHTDNVALGLDLHQKMAAQGMPVPHSGALPTHTPPPPTAPHGGAQAQAEPLSKHANEQSGKLPGGGLSQAVN